MKNDKVSENLERESGILFDRSSFRPFDAAYHLNVGAIILERTVRNGILHGPLKKR